MIHVDMSLTSGDRLTSILISRFLLNLQAAEQKSAGMVSSTSSQVESAIFQRVIGSLGNNVRFGADVDVIGVEEDGDRAGHGGAGDVESTLFAIERTQEGTAWEGAAHE